MTTHTCPTCYDTAECTLNATPWTNYCYGGCHASNCDFFDCTDPNCMYFSCDDCLEAAFIERLEQAGVAHDMQGGNPRLISTSPY